MATKEPLYCAFGSTKYAEDRYKYNVKNSIGVPKGKYLLLIRMMDTPHTLNCYVHLDQLILHILNKLIILKLYL